MLQIFKTVSLLVNHRDLSLISCLPYCQTQGYLLIHYLYKVLSHNLHGWPLLTKSLTQGTPDINVALVFLFLQHSHTPPHFCTKWNGNKKLSWQFLTGNVIHQFMLLYHHPLVLAELGFHFWLHKRHQHLEYPPTFSIPYVLKNSLFSLLDELLSSFIFAILGY